MRRSRETGARVRDVRALLVVGHVAVDAILGRWAVAQARMAWIRDRVNPDAPDEAHIVVGSERSEIGERVVSQLLNSAMKSDEGVFYLLPHDLCYEVTRSGGVVTVEMPTQSRDAADDAPEADDDAPTEWVTVLSAAIPFPEDATLPGPPVVVIDHEGAVSLDELVAAIPENGVHIIGPKPDA